MAAKPVEVVAATKPLLLLLSCLLVFQIAAQQTEVAEKRPISIEVLYDYYRQNGNNSAVTGGKGTEELTYHAPNLVIHIPADSLGQITVKAGVDVYSSASQDNIDFNVSSASSRDARTHLSVAYATENPAKEKSYSVYASGSIESDYTSLGIGGTFAKGWFSGNSVLQIGAQFYADDCRWGRLNLDVTELQLVYPVELRYREWYDVYRRYTSTVSLGFNQLITKRLNVGVYTDFVWQNGLLATSFHRVYFADQAEARVENLPENRYKLPIAMRLNYFAARRMLVRSYYRFYTDNWGITAHTLELETAFKVRTFFSIMPFYRFYSQDGAFWFRPYGEHLTSSSYYTSDFDLSTFTAHQFGVGINWKPAGGLFTSSRGYGWQGVQVRLGTYLRSNGLNAFFLSTAFFIGK